MPLACFKCVDTLPINADLPPQYAESLNLIRMVARILKLNRFFLEL